MIPLIWRCIIPLSIISFGVITKWWYALPADAPDTLYIGFPFPYAGDGWHTSMSLQIFVLELLVDFFLYFIFWFTVIFLVSKYLTQIIIYKAVAIGLWSIAGLFMLWALFVLSFPEHVFHVRRSYDMEIMETGYRFIWQDIERPDYFKYHPERK